MKHVIFDMDTQKEFLTSEGVRFVDKKGCENVMNNMVRAIKESILFGSLHVSTTIVGDMHNIYCVDGTVGIDKMDETIIVEPEYSYNCGNMMHGVDMSLVYDCWHINFEKHMSDIYDPLLGQPDNLETVLRSENIELVTIVGVNCDEGLFHTIDGLLRSKYHVQVILDAIWDVDDDSDMKHKLSRYDGRDVKFIQSVDDFTNELKTSHKYTPRNIYD